MSKVFCGNCRHFSSGDHYQSCKAVHTSSEDWFSEYSHPSDPKVLNKNNNCASFQKKRTMFQWVSDKVKRKNEIQESA